MVGDGETTVLVVENTADAARSLARSLPVPDGSIRTATDVESGVEAVTEVAPDCVVAGHCDALDGLTLLERVRTVDPDVPVVLYPETGDEATASAAVAGGVTDYVPRTNGEGERGGLDDLRDSVARVLGDGPGTVDHATRSWERRGHRGAVLVDLATDEAVTRGAIAEAPIGITIAAREGDDSPLVYVNDEFERLTGYNWDDVAGQDCRFLQGPDTAEAPVAELRRAIDEQRSTTVELLNYRADGTKFWNRVTIAPVETDDGGVDHYVGFQEDVTDRKRRERDLARSERQFTAIFEDPNILVGLLAPDGTVLDFNRTAMEYVDVDREAVVGNRFSETRWFESDDRRRAEVRRLVSRAAAGEYAEFEFDLRDATPRGLVASGVIRPVTDEAGTVVSLLISARDVSERRRRERQLDALDRVLRHNLHNEMNVVLGNAESIADLDHAAAADHAEAILEGGETLLDLTTKQRQIVDLLSDAPDLTTVDVAEAVRDCVEDLRDRYPDVPVDVTAPKGLSARAVPQIRQALSELLENAVLHGGSDPVQVALTATDETVTVSVADRGDGIPAEERAILLDEGERGPLYHGTGMGLWLVSWIVTYSEGVVDYEERDSQGSVVTITLHRADAENAT